MSRKINTRVGDRFGSRVITGFPKDRDTDGHLRCKWRCDCGNTGTGGLKSLRHTLTCVECRDRKANPPAQPVHGHASRANRTRLYDTWANTMQRTRAKSGRNARWYAGISVCPEWQKFEGFRDWALANGYVDGLSIDRLFVWGDYEPGNCEWVTRSENSRRAVQDEWRQFKECPINTVLSFGV
jgi:hypothetical protein